MTKLLGIFAWMGMVGWASGTESHAGSPNPDLEQQIEDSYGEPEGISLPEVQVVRFLGQRFPEMLAELEKAEGEGEGAEKRDEVLNRARGIILEWEEHFRVGEKVAQNFIEVERLHYQSDALVESYVKMEEGPEKLAKGDELRANLTKVHDLRMALEKAELERLKEEIVAIEENLKYNGENRATVIETELRDLLEYWRLEQAGETAGRDREEPLMPAEVVSDGEPGTEKPIPAVPAVPGTTAPEVRVEVARPVKEETGGGFVERGEEGEVVKPAEAVEGDDTKPE